MNDPRINNPSYPIESAISQQIMDEVAAQGKIHGGYTAYLQKGGGMGSMGGNQLALDLLFNHDCSHRAISIKFCGTKVIAEYYANRHLVDATYREQWKKTQCEMDSTDPNVAAKMAEMIRAAVQYDQSHQA